MSSTYGDILKLSIFGQSHGAAIGMTLDGIPAGLPVDEGQLRSFLRRRAPGNSAVSTARKEADLPEFLSGIVDGCTCGAPICAVIHNENIRSADYDALRDCPRPGHADFTAQVKYGGHQDSAGGGHFSGRLTAPLCIAGGLCKQWLSLRGIEIGAHLASVGDANDAKFDPMKPDFSAVSPDFPVIDRQKGAQMRDLIASARAMGDSQYHPQVSDCSLHIYGIQSVHCFLPSWSGVVARCSCPLQTLQTYPSASLSAFLSRLDEYC